MNTQNCTEGLFTDEIMMFAHMGIPCSSSVQTWLGLAISFSILRTALVLQVYRINKLRQSENNNNKIKRINHPCKSPGLIFGLLVGILQMLFVLLTSLNIASTRNGISPVLAGFFFIPTAFQHFIQLKVLMRLGRRLIPLSMKKYDIRDETLSKDDSIIRILFYCALLTIVIFNLSFILGACFPEMQRKIITFQIGFACVGTYQFIITLITAWQLQRLILAVKRLIREIKEAAEVVGTSGGQVSSTNSNSDISTAIRKMRRIQIVVLLIGGNALALSLLFATFTILISYYVFLIAFFIMDCILQGFLLMGDSLKRKKRKDDTSNTSNNNKPHQQQQQQIVAAGELPVPDKPILDYEAIQHGAI